MIHLLIRVSLTEALFIICSFEIFCSVSILLFLALYIVISVAKSLAFKRIVGIKSARAWFHFIFHLFFISFVDLPKRAVSHLLRIRAKFSSLLVCSNITLDNSFSVSVNFLRATTLS